MNKPNDSQATIGQGATAVINHRVRAGLLSDYDVWLDEIGPVCRAASGHLDWHVIRPITGLTTTYTVIIRFDAPEHLRAWLISHERKRLIEKVRPLLDHDDEFFVRSGLDFWFMPSGALGKVPVRWKQFLVTWSAIYLLVLGIPSLILPLLRLSGIPQNLFIDALFVTGTVVSLMVYLVMPYYTRLIRRWLFA